MTLLFSTFPRKGPDIDLAYLERIFDRYLTHGPDGSSIHRDESFWCGKHLLRSTALCETSAAISQKTDAGVSLVSMGRVDDRDSLINRFPRSDRRHLLNASHQDLLLECYLKWGLDWLQHVTGEFCGIIHDKRSHSTLLFTDRFGSRPIYYFYQSGLLIASTDLSMLVANEQIPIDINETAIARFLLFGIHDFDDDAITPYRYIHKVRKASQKVFTNVKITERCYWDILSIQSAYVPRKPDSLREMFIEQMHLALTDRVSHKSTGLLLSGGLDSTLLATLLSENRLIVPRLKAYTGLSHEQDEERKYVELTKRRLGISEHSWIAGSTTEPLAGYQPTSTPTQLLFPISFRQAVETMGKDDCRVMLRGTGADELLHDEHWTVVDGFKALGPVGGMHCFWQSLMELSGRPPLGIRKLWSFHGKQGKTEFKVDHLFPSWVSETLTELVDLEQMWHDAFQLKKTKTRPFARSCLARASWNPGSFLPNPMRKTFYYSDPFLDRRVVEFLLGIYPLPWAYTKHLLRSILAERLPRRVTSRPKTPAGNLMKWHRDTSWWKRHMEEAVSNNLVGAFVNLDSVPQHEVSAKKGTSYVDIRPLILSLWIQRLPKLRVKK